MRRSARHCFGGVGRTSRLCRCKLAQRAPSLGHQIIKNLFLADAFHTALTTMAPTCKWNCLNKFFLGSWVS